MQFDLKKIKTESVVPLAIVSGLAAGNLAYKAIPSKINPLIGAVILSAAGLLIAVNVKHDFIKNGALAMSAFGGLKLLNTISADPMSGMNGIGELGITLPEGVRSAIRKIIPSLNGDDDMQVIGTYNEFGTVDTDYQVVGADDEFGSVNYEMGNFGNVIGMGAGDELILPKLNGSDIDVAGLDGRRNTGRFAAFKPKGNNRPVNTNAANANNMAAMMRNKATNPSGIKTNVMQQAKQPMNLTCQVAGLGEVSVDIA